MVLTTAQISKVINDAAALSDALFKLKVDFDTFNSMQATNGVHEALTAQGAAFPPSFTLTPAKVEDARYALAVFHDTFTTALATAQPNLDALRLSLGVLTGTG